MLFKRLVRLKNLYGTVIKFKIGVLLMVNLVNGFCMGDATTKLCRLLNGTHWSSIMVVWLCKNHVEVFHNIDKEVTIQQQMADLSIVKACSCIFMFVVCMLD